MASCRISHTSTALLVFLAVADAQLPSRWQAQHHDALTGRGRPLLEPFIKGHRENAPLLLNPTHQHHDALTGRGQVLLEPFIKGHREDAPFVFKPQSQHHDALTGRGSHLPEPFIKGHVANQPSYDSDGYLRRPQAVDATTSSVSVEVPLCKVSGDQCRQYTFKRSTGDMYLNTNLRLATTLAGFTEGTCWQHGYDVNDGAQESNVPFIGKTNVRFFKKSNNELPNVEMVTVNSHHAAIIIASISLIGGSAAIIALLFRRGTFLVCKEPLLSH